MTRDTIIGTLQGDSRLSGGLSVGGGTTNYEELENKPTYNGHVIEGNLTSESLGIWQPFDFVANTEINTGLKWIDNKPIYAYLFDTTVPNTSGFHTWNLSANIDTAIYCMYSIHNEGQLTNIWWSSSADVSLSTFRPSFVEMNFRGTYYAGRRFYILCLYTKVGD